MKKYGLLILVMVLCFAFTACASNQEESLQESSTMQSADDSILDQKEQNGHTLTQGVYIKNLEEYEEYVTQWPSLSNFVTYEMIKSIGEFQAFSYDPTNYNKYMYFLQDGTGDSQILYVDPWVDEESPEIILDTFTESSLQRISTPQTGMILQGDIAYRYASGELYAISWREGNHRLTLGSIQDYPDNVTTTFVGKLLSAETAQATIASLPIFEENA